MKACINTLLPTIVRIVNLSFTEACFREILKLSAVEPRIKNPMLDNELRSSYRPISNLRFISKAIEKVAADRLNCHLTENDLHVPLQSAYKPSHGTETALLKVQDVILRSLDENNCVILLLLLVLLLLIIIIIIINVVNSFFMRYRQLRDYNQPNYKFVTNSAP